MTEKNLARIIVDADGKVIESSTNVILCSIAPIGQPRTERVYNRCEEEDIKLINRIASAKANSYALGNVWPEKDSLCRYVDYFSVQFYLAAYVRA